MSLFSVTFTMKKYTRWWFQIFFLCSPLFREDFQFDQYFSDGLKPPTSTCWPCWVTLYLKMFVFCSETTKICWFDSICRNGIWCLGFLSNQRIGRAGCTKTHQRHWIAKSKAFRNVTVSAYLFPSLSQRVFFHPKFQLSYSEPLCQSNDTTKIWT